VVGLSACGGGGVITVDPVRLTWGEVDFMEEMPAEGYSSTALTLSYEGDEEIELVLEELDFDHLCAPGFTGAPASLGLLSGGQSFSLFIGVCDYIEEEGERDTEVSGQVRFSAEGIDEIPVVPWSFTPVLSLSDGT
jgi:hypothetical protein